VEKKEKNWRRSGDQKKISGKVSDAHGDPQILKEEKSYGRKKGTTESTQKDGSAMLARVRGISRRAKRKLIAQGETNNEQKKLGWGGDLAESSLNQRQFGGKEKKMHR